MIKFLSGVYNKTPFIELLIFSILQLHIPEDELLDMELFHLMWLIDGHNNGESRMDARFANLMCLLGNVHRGKNSKAFKPEQFMPRKKKSQKEVEQDILLAFGVK